MPRRVSLPDLPEGDEPARQPQPQLLRAPPRRGLEKDLEVLLNHLRAVGRPSKRRAMHEVLQLAKVSEPLRVSEAHHGFRALHPATFVGVPTRSSWSKPRHTSRDGACWPDSQRAADPGCTPRAVPSS